MSISNISEIMTPSIITVGENDTVADVIQVFEKHKISGAPVVNASGDYVGVLSKTDLASTRLLSTLKEKHDAEHVTVKDLLQPKPLFSVSESDPIDSAIELMDKHQVHRIFVKNASGKMVGIVTTLDVVSRMRYSFESYL